MLREIECKYCDAEFSVENVANFGVICSHCKRLIKLECEYGFGPATPCRIYHGEKLAGVVDYANSNYYLRANTELFRLQGTYWEAINDALDIIRRRLSPHEITQDNSLEAIHNKKNIHILLTDGSLRLYGEWMGKPYDRPLRIKHVGYDGEILEIIFNRGNLLAYDPSGIICTEQEFRIEKAQKIKWIYIPDDAITEAAVITYTSADGKLSKSSKYGTERLMLESSVDAVYLGEWKWD